MEILVFQAFIVFTVIITRLVAARQVALICVGWTIFTFLMVFASPLVLLQLCTIWGSYSLLRKKSEELVVPSDTPKMATLSEPPRRFQGEQTAPAVKIRVSSQPILEILAVSAEKMNSGLDNIHLYVRRQREAHRATAALDEGLAAENALIDVALGNAQRQVERDRWLADDPERAEMFHEALAELAPFIDDCSVERGSPSKALTVPPEPDFRFPPRNVDSQLADAIEARIQNLQEARRLRFVGLARHLGQDAVLWLKFREALDELGMTRVWPLIEREAGNGKPTL